MNQQSFGQKTGPDTEAGSGAATTPAAGAGREATTGVKGANATEAVLGPFTIRDLAVFAATVILFVASLLPMFGGRYNLWNLNNLFFLGLGIVLPLAVTALFAARRLAPGTKVRIGSLSVDQFASVVASFAVAFFFLSVAGAYVPSLLVGLIGAVILFAATVLGRFLPFVSADFQGRAESPAHVVAREAAVPVQKPKVPTAPKAAAGMAGSSDAASGSKLGGGKLLGAAGGKLFGGAGAGSSAVQGGAPHQTPATAAVPAAAASPSPATAAVPAAGVPAAGGPAADGPVSTAPEVSDRAPEGDAGPPTQAADVVRPASAPAAEETQFGDVPVRGSGASGSSAAPHHDGGAPAGSAAQGTWEPPAATAVHQQVRTEEPIGATVDPANRPEESGEQPIHEAFWFAVAQHRTAFDPRTGAPAFVIEPGGWVLALEDRGHEFLVQHTDGRLGVLRDLSNIERG
ncbi:energy-coupling factor transporter transmembrane component T family protein [Arthrobacter sp. D3-16]